MFELLNDEVIKMQHENISTSDLRASEPLAFTWSPFRLSRNKCSTRDYASNEWISLFIFYQSLFTCRVYFLVSYLFYARLNTFRRTKTHSGGISGDWLHWCMLVKCRTQIFPPTTNFISFSSLNTSNFNWNGSRSVEWCSRLLFHDSTDKRFAQLFAQLWPWWWKCGSMPIKTKVGPPLQLHAQSLPAPGWRGKKRQDATPCYYYTTTTYTSPYCTLWSIV